MAMAVWELCFKTYVTVRFSKHPTRIVFSTYKQNDNPDHLSDKWDISHTVSKARETEALEIARAKHLEMTVFTIEPIPGRSAVQKNFATLPAKANNYSNRKISLNERFAVIERGFYLKPVEAMEGSDMTVSALKLHDSVPASEFINNIAATVEKKKARNLRDGTSSQNSQKSCASSPRSQTTQSPKSIKEDE